jgi:hypothetical protein
MGPQRIGGIAIRTEVCRTDARKAKVSKELEDEYRNRVQGEDDPHARIMDELRQTIRTTRGHSRKSEISS